MDLSVIVQIAAALAFVLALITLIAWVLRRYFGGEQRGQAAMRRRNRRLSIVEAAPLGARHRLVLVRRDDTEHLILIGGASEVVVESGITRPMPTSDVSVRGVEPHFEPTGFPGAPRRDDFAQRREPAPRDYEPESFARTRFESAFRPHGEEDYDREEAESGSDLDIGEEREPSFRSAEPALGRDSPGEFRRPERPGFLSTEPPTLARSERGGLFSNDDPDYAGEEPRQHRDEPDDYPDEAVEDDRYHRDRRDRDYDEGDDEAGRAQSRILSRFLKRDEG